MPEKQGQYVYGRNSVLAILRQDPRRVYKILKADGMKAERRLKQIEALAREHQIPLQTVPRQKLDTLAGEPDAPHQGIMASVAPKPLLTLHELISREKEKIGQGEYPVVLLLDGITDPRNFGAILRVADGAGVSAVVIPKHHSAGFGPAVAKTASGAEATMDVVVVSNLVQAILPLKEAGFWVVGAASDESVPEYFRQDYQMPTVLVLGSEGEGLGRSVEKVCDFQVRIPMCGSVESLNVAVAAGVLLFDRLARRELPSSRQASPPETAPEGAS